MRSTKWKEQSKAWKAKLLICLILWFGFVAVIVVGIAVGRYYFLHTPIYRFMNSLYNTENTDAYLGYQCYDRRLTYTPAENDPIAHYELDDSEHSYYGESFRFYVYDKIPGESLSEFVNVAVSFYHRIQLTGPYNYAVYQNPEQYINVREQWNIKEIQITKSNNSEKVVVETVTNAKYIHQMYDLINTKETEDVPLKKILQTMEARELGDLAIYISFHESQNIQLLIGVKCLEDSSGKKILLAYMGLDWYSYIYLEEDSDWYKLLLNEFDKLSEKSSE